MTCLGRGAVAFAVVAAALGAVACESGTAGDSDADAFCATYQELGDDNPFDHLAMATPTEMQAAFDQLLDAATAMAETAPAEIAPQADRYLATVRAVVAELDAAAFDPSHVDAFAYGQARADYVAAATTLGREQTALCAED